MYLGLGLFILRVALGLALAAHGTQKLFGWFGGSGWQGWVNANGRMRLRPALFWALVGGLSEFGGGVLLALGFLSPLGSLGVLAAMAMAIRTHWPKGYWASKGGFEYPMINLVAALALALSGPGAISVDGVLGITLPEPGSVVIGLLLVLVGLMAAVVIQSLQPGSPVQAGPRSS